MDSGEKLVSVSLGRERHKMQYVSGMKFSAIREELCRLTGQDAGSFRLLCKGRTANDTDAVPIPGSAPVQVLALLTKSGHAHGAGVSSGARREAPARSVIEARESLAASASSSSSRPMQTVERMGKVTGGEEISEGERHVIALVNGKRYRVRTPQGCTAGDVKKRLAGFDGVDAYASEMIVRGTGRVLRDEDVFDVGGQRTIWIQLAPQYHERCKGGREVSRIESDAQNLQKRAGELRRQLQKRLACVEEARVVLAELKRDLLVIKDQIENVSAELWRKDETRNLIREAESVVEQVAQMLALYS